MIRLSFSELIKRGSLIVNDGYRTKKSELAVSGIPILRVAEVGEGFLSPKSADRIGEDYRTAIGAKLSQPGDVLLTTKGTVGRRAIVPTSGGGFAYSPQLCFFRLLDDSIDMRWLYYWLGGEEFWGQAFGVSTQTDMAPYISLRDLRAITLSLPPLSEQREIAATLGALDDKIESNRRAIGLIVGIIRARFDGDFDVEQAADGVAIGELVSINSRRKLARDEEATYIGMSSLPEFSPTVLYWEKRAFGNGQKFVNGDVLMARITPCLENGKTAVVDMLSDGEVGWGSTEYVVLSPRGAFSTPWIYALTRHETIRDWAIKRMTGSSGRQRFQASGFDEYRIREPNPAVLTAFNDFAVPMFRKIAQVRDEIKMLEQLRDSLLPELLSGRIRVPTKGESS